MSIEANSIVLEVVCGLQLTPGFKTAGKTYITHLATAAYLIETDPECGFRPFCKLLMHTFGKPHRTVEINLANALEAVRQVSNSSLSAVC